MINNNNLFMWRKDRELIIGGPKIDIKKRINLILAINKNEVILGHYYKNDTISTKEFLDFIKQELILFIVGGIFVAEALSVMIQVSVFKRTKKRVFRMAPIHHHFELGGLAETKVTIRFWIVGIILAIVAISFLKLR